MPLDPTITITRSDFKARKSPRLSILIPFYKDDPSDLLADLGAQIGGAHAVDIWLYDDGSNDKALETRMSQAVKAAPASVHLMTASGNRGRSYARNKLQESAGAEWVLFLDADMRPVTDHFIADYLTAIEGGAADIIFGGFHVPKHTENPEHELHRAFSETSDCLTLEQRKTFGPQYVCSSNLCVRKSVLDAEPFDPDFTGWGWEDSEWAARVAKRFHLEHVDIPALHLGLETTDTLLNRFKDSGANYQRFTHKHPDIAKTLTLYNVTQQLKKVPGQKLLRPLLKAFVKLSILPVKVRLFALKLWRASWYAEAL